MQDEHIQKHLRDIHGKIEAFLGGECKGFFAGGVFASLVLFEKPKDYDVWFRSRQDFDLVAALVGERVIKKSRFAITISLDSGEEIQFVSNRIGEPEKTISGFDFGHTRSYFCANSGEYRIARTLIENKELEYTPGCLEHPVNSFQRVMKFARLGYHMEFESIKHFMLDMKEVPEDVIVFNHSGSR